MKHPNRLRVVRAERRITQLDTAIKAGMHVNRYWRIENGYEQPTAAEKKALLKVLQTSEAEAFPDEAIAS